MVLYLQQPSNASEKNKSTDHAGYRDLSNNLKTAALRRGDSSDYSKVVFGEVEQPSMNFAQQMMPSDEEFIVQEPSESLPGVEELIPADSAHSQNFIPESPQVDAYLDDSNLLRSQDSLAAFEQNDLADLEDADEHWATQGGFVSGITMMTAEERRAKALLSKSGIYTVTELDSESRMGESEYTDGSSQYN